MTLSSILCLSEREHREPRSNNQGLCLEAHRPAGRGQGDMEDQAEKTEGSIAMVGGLAKCCEITGGKLVLPGGEYKP